MNEQIQVFSYTAQRTSYLMTVGTLLFFLCIESSVLALLALVLVHLLLLTLALLLILVCFLAFIVMRLIAPLRTQHSLTQTQLSLRYGSAFKVDILCTDLLDAQAVHEQVTMFQPMTPSYDEKRHRIVASFSDQGQVLLRLHKPHVFKVNNKTSIADTVLINVDKRDEFLQALGMSNNHAEESTIGRDRLIASSLPPTMPTGRDQSVPTETLVRSQAESVTTMPTGRDQSVPTEEANDAPAIHIEGLTRRFGTSVVVDKLSMSISPGEIYGFLGSNGAGKTTTMKMLVGLLQPDEGHMWLAGHDVGKDALAAKAAMGYVADRSILYERLTGREFLTFLGQIGYASGIAVWHVLEVAPSAISGEANRLTLYLTAPLKLAQIIRAKLVLFLFPVLVEGMFITLFLSYQIKLSLSQLGVALVAVLCIITACVALPVLGGAWDTDLNMAVEGRLQTLLLEEAPISPKRMGLLNLSVLLFVGMLLLVWKASTPLALMVLVVTNIVLLVGMWKFSLWVLQLE